jgi:hypothetical protein
VTHRELFADVRQHPERYGVRPSYRCFCAFLAGVGATEDGALLGTFRLFLVTRLGYADNLAWTALVLHLAFPGRDNDWGTVLDEPGHEEIATDALFSLLDEFLERWSRYESRLMITADYLAWRQEHRRRELP